jgi:hypothetical protein
MSKERGVNPDRLSSGELNILTSVARDSAAELSLGISGQAIIMRQHPDLFGQRYARNIEEIQNIAQNIPINPNTVAPPAALQTALQAAEQPATAANAPAGQEVQDSGYNFATAELGYAAAETNPEQTVAAAQGFGTGNREVMDPEQPEAVVQHNEYVQGLAADQEALVEKYRAQLDGVLAEQGQATQAVQPARNQAEYGVAG